MMILKTTDGEDGDYWRRCFMIAEGNDRPMVYEERDRRLFCNCCAYYNDCEHKQLVIQVVMNELKAIAKQKQIVNECGTEQAKAIQDKLNGQIDSQNNNGNGAKATSQPMTLDLNNPFEESEQYDIDQIEGRRNGELAWKLRNGDYCISYNGIMKLAEKHGIEFDEVSVNNDTVIAKAKNGSERISGKPTNDNANTAMELAKRNAARALLPLPEILALERKTKLNTEFSWEKAKAACLKLVPDFHLSIIINDLTQAGKLRTDNPSGYNRTEWLLIHEYCKKDAEVVRSADEIQRWSYNSVVTLEQCQAAIAKVREEKKKRKPVEQIFGRSNDTTKKLSKLYDEKPLEFEVDTTKPNWVKMIYSNGTVAKVYDQVIYESVLRA